MEHDRRKRLMRWLAVVVGVLLCVGEAGHSWEFWRRWLAPGTVARAPVEIDDFRGRVSKVEKEAEEAGVAKGDMVVAVNGKPLENESHIRRAVFWMKPGETLALRLKLAGGSLAEADIRLKAFAGTGSWDDRIIGFFLDFFSRWMCVGLGLFVVMVRPLDRLAWLVQGMLVSFSFLGTTMGAPQSAWPPPLMVLRWIPASIGPITWPLWMLLFGLDFPDPRSKVRLLGWTKWLVMPPVLLLALVATVLNIGGALGRMDLEPLVRVARPLGAPMLYIGMACISVFFINITYKARKEPDPDSRRRLKLFYWGAAATLTPLLFLLVASNVAKDTLSKTPEWTLLPPLVLMSMFPAVVGYVIVVERAMDVRVVLRQGLQYALASRGVRVVQVALSAVVVFAALNAATGMGARRALQMQMLAWALIGVLLLGRFAGRLQSWLDKRFFREQVDAERVLSELAQKVRGVTEEEELRRLVEERVAAGLHVERVEMRVGQEGARNGFELKIPLEGVKGRLGWLLLGPKKSEEPYSKGDVRLLESVAAQTAMALDNGRLAREVASQMAHREVLEHELSIAREVQERLLPQKKPRVPGLDYAGLCRPASSVGGDCYEHMLDSRGSLWMAIGDVAGKGVPAALLMAGVNSALRGLLAADVREPAELMKLLNRVLYESTPRNRFVTLFLARFDPETSDLVYSSAGHNPMLLRRASGETEWLATKGVGLGLTGQSTYKQASVRLAAGDVFAMYTDGVTEARSASGDEFGEQRLLAALNGRGALGMTGCVVEAIDAFAEGAPQHDDITLLIGSRI
jgi:sigma-B regulation protein RsbU (phosphoserine phosphatase)